VFVIAPRETARLYCGSPRVNDYKWCCFCQACLSIRRARFALLEFRMRCPKIMRVVMVGVCRDNVEITVTYTLLFVRSEITVSIIRIRYLSKSFFSLLHDTCNITDYYLRCELELLNCRFFYTTVFFNFTHFYIHISKLSVTEYVIFISSCFCNMKSVFYDRTSTFLQLKVRYLRKNSRNKKTDSLITFN